MAHYTFDNVYEIIDNELVEVEELATEAGDKVFTGDYERGDVDVNTIDCIRIYRNHILKAVAFGTIETINNFMEQENL